METKISTIIYWFLIGEIKNSQADAEFDYVEVVGIVSEEELARCILTRLKPFMYGGMTKDEFRKLLMKYFGVASNGLK